MFTLTTEKRKVKITIDNGRRNTQSNAEQLQYRQHTTSPGCWTTHHISAITAHQPITSHVIEETDAGLGRPLYLRNKLYNKTLKSENLLL